MRRVFRRLEACSECSLLSRSVNMVTPEGVTFCKCVLKDAWRSPKGYEKELEPVGCLLQGCVTVMEEWGNGRVIIS